MCVLVGGLLEPVGASGCHLLIWGRRGKEDGLGGSRFLANYVGPEIAKEGYNDYSRLVGTRGLIWRCVCGSQ